MKRNFGTIVKTKMGRFVLQIRKRNMQVEKRFYTEDAARLESVMKHIEYLGGEAAEARKLLSSFDYQKVVEAEEDMRLKALKRKPQNKMLKKRIENKAGTWVHDPERPQELPIGGNNGQKDDAQKKV